MSKGRVLVVDDAPIIRLMIRGILEFNGYEVVAEAGNGQEAIEQYKAVNPDVVTMDVIMPIMDGIEALAGILLYNPQAKVIMVTAIDQRDSLIKAIRIGATDYIIKPFEDARVMSSIWKAMGVDPDEQTLVT